MVQIVAATRNKHKLEELRKQLSAQDDAEIIGLDVYPQAPEVVEDGQTFAENAAKKALSANLYTDLPAFADDSGLCVEALDGAPGINSARYAEGSDADRVAKLLEVMKGVSNRKAKFVCVIAIAINGEVIDTFTGEVHGTIAEEPRGNNGFGYDPVFIPENMDKTFGELPDEIKDGISHRHLAVKAALEFVEDELSSAFDDAGF
ncbi:MAG: RdgB/HAM1 family non-canonical purine NTP pyrophosphatase [Victivallales bacterium]|jgi:XTP/dITP diphosphohydrolase|nr:RdgB/HAM1 family non-canonical purine NTP pyrophosphatase [Victivallales bacterium]